MQVDFPDTELQRVVEQGAAPAGWSVDELARVRLIAQCARAAKVSRDLESLQSLRLRHHPDDELECLSAPLSPRRRLVVFVKSEGTDMTAVFDVLPKETESPT